MNISSSSGENVPFDRLLQLVYAARFYCRVPPLDTCPHVVAFAQTKIGQGCLYVVFAGMLLPSRGWLSWLGVTFFAAACALAGSYRRWILSLATLSGLIAHTIHTGPFSHPYSVIGLLLFILFSLVAVQFTVHFRENVISRWPVSCLIGTFFAFFLLAWSSVVHGLPQGLLWSFTFTFSACIWYLAYALRDLWSPNRTSFLVQLGAFGPFWGYWPAPFGKGLSYLSKVEAKNSQELAITQLKGVKLLFWAWVLNAMLFCIQMVVHQILNVPSFATAFSMQIAGTPFPWYVCWGSLISEFVETLLVFAVSGHQVVACARIAGFRLLRNTYRPLESRTIAEFWNRYYFYFKELLADHFFYPTFLSIFKRHRRVRLVFATFMAAGVGNFLFHVIRDIGPITEEQGLVRAIWGFQTFAFYCFVLAFGIAVSQIRAHRTKRYDGSLSSRLMPVLWVALFYCVLHIFDDTRPDYSLWDHFKFLLHLVDVHI